MEEVHVVANFDAVVELSAKVATLCSQYSTAVFDAQTDITRLQIQVASLDRTLRHAQRLANEPNAKPLSSHDHLVGQLQECEAELQWLQGRLNPTGSRRIMRLVGRRTLKWPFTSKATLEAALNLERQERLISAELQIKQPVHTLAVDPEVESVPPQATEAPSTTGKPHFIVPFPRDPDFVDRPAIQSWIKEQYLGPNGRMALVGMGGFGKSQIAIEFAHCINVQWPNTTVFWVHAGTKATFEESYRYLADVLELPRRHDPQVNILALVRDWLQRQDTDRWLMVLDNADDVGTFFDRNNESGPKMSMAVYLPKMGNGKILITTRNLEAAERLTGDQRAILRISAMDNSEALQLCRNKLDTDFEETAAVNLVGVLDCVPLAVSQAVAYINRRAPRMSIRAYLDQFSESEKQKDSLLKHDAGDLRRYEGVSNSVVVTWQVTFEQIRRERPSAANLLSLMTIFSPQNIPEYMLYGYTRDSLTTEDTDEDDEDEFEDDLDTLRAYSLINVTTPGGFCEMHSLVQFCTQKWLSASENLHRWESLFLRSLSRHFPSGAFETWNTCQILLPHLHGVLRNRPSTEPDIIQWAQLLTKASWYMLMRGDYVTAEALVHMAVDARKLVLGAEHPHTLTSMANLALAYRNQGRWDEAEVLEVQVMETTRRVLGEGHPDTLFSMANLAATFWNQGRLSEAESLEVQVMEATKRVLGDEHQDTLFSMANLAATFWNQGRLDEAESLQLQVMETISRVLGDEHPDTLTSMGNLAVTFKNQGRLAEAKSLELQVLKTRQRVLGETHPDTLTSMSNLALTLWAVGLRDQAKNLMVSCVSLRRIVLGPDHPRTKSSIERLQLWQGGGSEYSLES